jgi:hypothetical protein
MPSPGACSGPDEELVDLTSRDNLVDERVNRSAPSIDDALTADLDHSGIRQDPKVRRRFHRSYKLRIGERPLHEKRLELRRRVCHKGTSFRFSRRSRTREPFPLKIAGSHHCPLLIFGNSS